MLSDILLTFLLVMNLFHTFKKEEMIEVRLLTLFNLFNLT